MRSIRALQQKYSDKLTQEEFETTFGKIDICGNDECKYFD